MYSLSDRGYLTAVPVPVPVHVHVGTDRMGGYSCMVLRVGTVCLRHVCVCVVVSVPLRKERSVGAAAPCGPEPLRGERSVCVDVHVYQLQVHVNLTTWCNLPEIAHPGYNYIYYIPSVVLDRTHSLTGGPNRYLFLRERVCWLGSVCWLCE